MRIVSMLPSNTELACALGLDDQLVGVSHECDFPTHVTSLPRVTASRVDSTASQGDINEQVNSVFAGGQSLYRIDEQGLAALKPNLILTQAKCEVCAVDYDDVVATSNRLWPDDPPRILSFQPSSIFDVLSDLIRLGRAADRVAPARQVVAQLTDLSANVIRHQAELPTDQRPGVVFLEWLDPLMSCGCWTTEMIQLAGGRILISRPGDKAIWTTAEAITEAQPDVMVLAACGMDVARTQPVADALLRESWAQNLPSTRNQRVFVVDGNAYFNRPGPRLVDSLELLSAMFLERDLGAFQGFVMRAGA